MPKVYVSPSVQEHNVGVGDYGTEKQRMQVIGALVETYLRANGFDMRRNRPEMKGYCPVLWSDWSDPLYMYAEPSFSSTKLIQISRYQLVHYLSGYRDVSSDRWFFC